MKKTQLTPEIHALRTTDIDELEALTPEQFRNWHRSQMVRYRFFSKGQIPCDECHSPIKDPEDMIRYHGRTLDYSCFSEQYKAERSRLYEWSRRYFDLVGRLMAPQPISN